jgi:hypothetical protein
MLVDKGFRFPKVRDIVVLQRLSWAWDTWGRVEGANPNGTG